MPRIPTYDARERIVIAPPAVLTPPVGQGRGEEVLGRALSNIGETFRRADAENQLTKAKVDTMRRMDELELRWQQSPEPDFTAFQSELRGFTALGAKDIRYRDAREEFSRWSDLAAVRYEGRLREFTNKKIVERGSELFDSIMKQFQENYVRADSQEDRDITLENMRRIKESHIQRGFLTPEQAQLLFDAYIKELPRLQVERLIDISPIEAIEALDADYHGIRETDRELWRRLRGEAETRRNQIEKATENELIRKFNFGEDINVAEVTQLSDEGKISPDFAGKMIKNIHARWTEMPVETDPATFVEFHKKAIREGLNLEDFGRETSEAYHEGTLSISDLRLLNKIANAPDSRERDLIRNSNLQLQTWITGNVAEEERATASLMLSRKFYSRVAQEKAKGERINEIREEIINSFNTERRLSAVPVGVAPVGASPIGVTPVEGVQPIATPARVTQQAQETKILEKIIAEKEAGMPYQRAIEVWGNFADRVQIASIYAGRGVMDLDKMRRRGFMPRRAWGQPAIMEELARRVAEKERWEKIDEARLKEQERREEIFERKEQQRIKEKEKLDKLMLEREKEREEKRRIGREKALRGREERERRILERQAEKEKEAEARRERRRR